MLRPLNMLPRLSLSYGIENSSLPTPPHSQFPLLSAPLPLNPAATDAARCERRADGRPVMKMYDVAARRNRRQDEIGFLAAAGANGVHNNAHAHTRRPAR